MTQLIRFMDNDRRGRWANIRMDNGDPCWVSLAQTGVLVKKSRVGLFGAKLYDESNLWKAAETAQALDDLYPLKLTPREMSNPVFVAFVNAILHCSALAEVAAVLNTAHERVSGFHEAGAAEDFGFCSATENVLSRADADAIFALNRDGWAARTQQYALPPGWQIRVQEADMGAGLMAINAISGIGLLVQPMFRDEDPAAPELLHVGCFYPGGTLGPLDDDLKRRLLDGAKQDLGSRYEISVSLSRDAPFGTEMDAVNFLISKAD